MNYEDVDATFENENAEYTVQNNGVNDEEDYNLNGNRFLNNIYESATQYIGNNDNNIAFEENMVITAKYGANVGESNEKDGSNILETDFDFDEDINVSEKNNGNERTNDRNEDDFDNFEDSAQDEIQDFDRE